MRQCDLHSIQVARDCVISWDPVEKLLFRSRGKRKHLTEAGGIRESGGLVELLLRGYKTGFRHCESSGGLP